jgi:rod shape-determining protein MreD
VRRAALAAALLLLAILIQVTLVNSLPWPGAAGPDLVLVAVVALALTGGPLEGMLAGFCAGLALDVAPPATHLIGQYAGVLPGRVRLRPGRQPPERVRLGADRRGGHRVGRRELLFA